MSERAAQQSGAGASAARWLKPALLVSVALNLLIIGVIAGFMIRHYKRSGGHSYRANTMLGFARALPAERRLALRPILDEIRRSLRPLRHQYKQTRRAVRQAVLAAPFESKVYETAVAKRLQALVELRKARNTLFVQLNEKLSAGERKDYVEWLRQRQYNRRHGRPYGR